MQIRTPNLLWITRPSCRWATKCVKTRWRSMQPLPGNTELLCFGSFQVVGLRGNWSCPVNMRAEKGVYPENSVLYSFSQSELFEIAVNSGGNLPISSIPGSLAGLARPYLCSGPSWRRGSLDAPWGWVIYTPQEPANLLDFVKLLNLSWIFFGMLITRTAISDA